MISMYLSKNVSEQVIANIRYLSIAVWSDASTAEITSQQEMQSNQENELTVGQIRGMIQVKYRANNTLSLKECFLENEGDV
jgi:hypothetical protein